MSYEKAMRHNRNLRKCRKQGRMYKGFDCCSGPTPSFWSSPLLAARENVKCWFKDRHVGDPAHRQYIRECIREQIAAYRDAYAAMLAKKENATL